MLLIHGIAHGNDAALRSVVMERDPREHSLEHVQRRIVDATSHIREHLPSPQHGNHHDVILRSPESFRLFRTDLERYVLAELGYPPQLLESFWKACGAALLETLNEGRTVAHRHGKQFSVSSEWEVELFAVRQRLERLSSAEVAPEAAGKAAEAELATVA